MTASMHDQSILRSDKSVAQDATQLPPRTWALANCLSATLVLASVGCTAIPKAATPAAPPTSAAAGATTIVAVAPAAGPPHPTLPEFLGLNALGGALYKGGAHIANTLGARFPGLEAKPPILAITDPANSAEGASPAVAAAAEAKAEEDKAPQKAKAIAYLAKLGCGKCNPKAEEALIAALDDCTESVRYAVVDGLRRNLGNECRGCQGNSCCTPKLTEKLFKIGYDVDDSGCYVELSPRVRRLARLVIQQCGGVAPPAPIPSSPNEGPSSEDIPVPAPAAEEGPGPLPAPPQTEPSALQEPAVGPRSLPGTPRWLPGTPPTRQATPALSQQRPRSTAPPVMTRFPSVDPSPRVRAPQLPLNKLATQLAQHAEVK